MEYTGLFPDEVRKLLPAMYEQENRVDVKAIAKFFTPWTDWTWYASEGAAVIDEDGKEIDFMFFGLVIGNFVEYGYFSLGNLQALDGPAGLRIERDMDFEPTLLDELHAKHSDDGEGE